MKQIWMPVMEKKSPIFCSKITERHTGFRLDSYLSKQIPDYSRVRIQSAIEDGLLKRNGEVFTTANHKIKEGEEYEFYAIPEKEIKVEAENIPLHIFYQDDDIIVFNKPAGLTVHIGAGHQDKTLVNALLFHTDGKLAPLGGETRPGIVHRLDKDTSGIMIAAKTDAAHMNLAKQFSEHTIKREYDAFCWGLPIPIEGRIETHIGRHPHQRKKMTILKTSGKNAITNYRTVDTYYHNKISHIRCKLETGRTHQIRVHMAYINHPLIGDETYGKDKKNIQTLENTHIRSAVQEIKRQMLHARLLEFNHPITGERMSFSTNLPDDMREFKEKIEEYDI